MPLSLSRRPLESIRIGKDILIEVAAVEYGKVRLRITAPDDVLILRTELEGQPDFKLPPRLRKHEASRDATPAPGEDPAEQG